MLTGILFTLVVLFVIAAMFKWVYKQVTVKNAHQRDPHQLLEEYMVEYNRLTAERRG